MAYRNRIRPKFRKVHVTCGINKFFESVEKQADAPFYAHRISNNKISKISFCAFISEIDPIKVNQQDFECHVASFQKTNDVFSEIIGQNGRFEAKSMWSLLSKSIASFGENFVADYEDFCKLDAAHPDCDLVELRWEILIL